MESTTIKQIYRPQSSHTTRTTVKKSCNLDWTKNNPPTLPRSQRFTRISYCHWRQSENHRIGRWRLTSRWSLERGNGTIFHRIIRS